MIPGAFSIIWFFIPNPPDMDDTKHDGWPRRLSVNRLVEMVVQHAEVAPESPGTTELSADATPALCGRATTAAAAEASLRDRSSQRRQSCSSTCREAFRLSGRIAGGACEVCGPPTISI